MNNLSRRQFTATLAAGPLSRSASLPPLRQRPLAAGAVKEIGGFAGRRLYLNKDRYLKVFPAGGFLKLVEEKKHREWWWIGEQPGKWLHAAILAEMAFPDPELRKSAEAALVRMIAAQEPDGYLGVTDPAMRTARRPIRGMDPYELFFTLHMLVLAHEVWGNQAALGAARRLGGFFCDKIGPGKAEFWPLPKPVTIAGHEVHYGLEGTLLINPMMRLHQATSDDRYLKWCQWAVENIDRWSNSGTFSNLDEVAAGRMQLNEIQPNVHSHTLHMNMLGFLRMYRATGDAGYLRKVEGAWRSITANYLYITGGVSVGEGYTEPHRLPNTGSVVETCASMSWIQLNQALLELTSEPRYADAIEKLMWNHLFAAQTIDGDGFRYHCALNGWKPLQCYTGPDCCSASGPLILSELPQMFYGATDDCVYVNQFVSSRASARLAGQQVVLRQSTDYPAKEVIAINVEPESPAEFSVAVRMPAWCRQPLLRVNGRQITDVKSGAYALLRRTWNKGDHIELTLPMSAEWIRGEHTNQGLTALVRGPQVFALDAAWSGEAEGDALAGDRSHDNLPGLAGMDRGLSVQPAPAGALGPFYRVTVRLAGGKTAQMLMTPFANLGKWYRSEVEKARGPRPFTATGELRPRPAPPERTIPYAVWLKA